MDSSQKRRKPDGTLPNADRARIMGKELHVSRNNILYLVLGGLVVVVAALSYELYRDRHPPQPQGLHIDLGPNGLSIQGK
jgi:hypothetical protein